MDSDGGMLLARHAVKEAASFRWINLLLEEVNNQVHCGPLPASIFLVVLMEFLCPFACTAL